MTAAQFQVVHAGPLVSIQDAGRYGHMRYGVTPAGPMDKRSHRAANLALSNDPAGTAIEVSAGGLVLKCVSGAVSFAVVGGDFIVECGDARGASFVSTIEAGQSLSIRPGQSGSWCYLAFAGSVQAPEWLGHTATHALTGLGGGMITSGEQLTIDDCHVAKDREGALEPFVQPDTKDCYRVVIGPQDQHFSAESQSTLLNSEYRLSSAYDRMGVRLEGPVIAPSGALSIPSEPVLRGAIQVSGDGIPTVLLADHQTTGGYPKIATLISSDFDDFVQRRANDTVRFVAITAEAAVTCARVHAQNLQQYFDAVAKPKGTLEFRLQTQNLISGVVAAQDRSQQGEHD